MIKDNSININLKKEKREYNISICDFKNNKFKLPENFYEKTDEINGIILFNQFIRFYIKDNVEDYIEDKKLKKYICKKSATFTINKDKEIHKKRGEQDIPFIQKFDEGYIRISNKNYFDIIPIEYIETYLCENKLQSFYDEYQKLYEAYIENNKSSKKQI